MSKWIGTIITTVHCTCRWALSVVGLVCSKFNSSFHLPLWLTMWVCCLASRDSLIILYVHTNLPNHSTDSALTCRSVLFWDIRPPLQKKANEANKPKTAVASDQPFSYLDLTWKPFLKVWFSTTILPELQCTCRLDRYISSGIVIYCITMYVS